MRVPFIIAIYRKEMLDLVRDRRTLISMVLVPALIIPLLLLVVGRLINFMEARAERESKTMTIGLKVSNPRIRQALLGAGLQVADNADIREAIARKTIVTGVEETPGPVPQIRVYSDNTNPTSSTASEKIRSALAELKEATIRERLRASGVPESVLSPFDVLRVNVAPPKKMAGLVWGSMLGYMLLLLMFSGGMYPIIDMTAGEKERRTLESFLATPAGRNEIVLGKLLAGVSAILLTATLTLASMVVSLRSAHIGGSKEMKGVFNAMPLDAHTITLILLTLLPVCVLAASVMIAIAMFARSFKEGQSYLTPLMLVVLFPAMLGGLPQLELTWQLCLIPIFNASQLIRAILLGEFTGAAFAVTLVANLVYAGIAVAIAKNRFENESVLFRS